MARAVLALVLVLHAATARAEDAKQLIADADRAYSELRFVEAVALLDRAWRLGESDPAQLRQIFALAGQAAGSTGDREAATTWFARWLAIEPGADLPAGTSPKLVAVLRDARAQDPRISASATARAPDVTVKLRDPLHLVAAVRAGATRREVSGAVVQLPIVEGDIALLDRHGNVLATIPILRALETVPAPPAPRRWFERWPAWTIGAGGLAAIGSVALYVAVDARATIRDYDAHSQDHQYADRLRYADRLDTALWTSRIAFGAAAVTGIVAVVLWRREVGEHVVVHASGEGGSLAWRLAW